MIVSSLFCNGSTSGLQTSLGSQTAGCGHRPRNPLVLEGRNSLQQEPVGNVTRVRYRVLHSTAGSDHTRRWAVDRLTPALARPGPCAEQAFSLILLASGQPGFQPPFRLVYIADDPGHAGAATSVSHSGCWLSCS